MNGTAIERGRCEVPLRGTKMKREVGASGGRVVAVRLQVDLDKLEDLANARARRSANKWLPGVKWPGWLPFPPEQTPVTDTVAMKTVLRHVAIFSLFVTLYLAVCIFVIVALLAYAFLSANLHHHLHHLHWRLIKHLYSFSLHRYFQRDPPLDYVKCVVAMSGLSFGFFSALRWAWNRRADRLNREAALTPSITAVLIGVWPPPPLGPADAVTKH